MNDSSFINNPLRSSAIFRIENDDKHCFFGRFLLVYIFVRIVVLTEFQIIDNFLMN